MKSAAWSSFQSALPVEARIGGESDETWNPNEQECKTCLGAGRVEDADTGEMRKCLDCTGRGKVPSP